jgi:ketosteroid isomerase-like protein
VTRSARGRRAVADGAVRDELAIRDLVAGFAECVNESRPQELTALFAPDAEFVIEGRAPVRGSSEIAGFLSGVLERWEMIFQAVTSGRVSVDGDHARGDWYVTEYGRYGNGDETFLGGRYRDEYERAAGGWRFSRRQFRSMWRRAEPTGDLLRVHPIRDR